MDKIYSISDKLYNDVSTFIYSIEGHTDLIKNTYLELPVLRLINNLEKYGEERKKLVKVTSYEDICDQIRADVFGHK